MRQGLRTSLISATLFLTIASLPLPAGAFWPFSRNADAATDIIPSSSTPALDAPTNVDPNAPAASPLPTSGDAALVPYTGPNGNPGDSIVTPATERISTYLVRTGDTLSEIAVMFGVSVNTIIWANDLKSAKDVRPGDTLIILPVSGIEHTVAKSETLASLAKKYGGDAGEIAAYNGLYASTQLTPGMKIIIPGGEIATAPAPTKKSPKRLPTSEPYLGGSGTADNGYWSNPIPGGLITQGIHGHDAVDIGAARGTPIHAAADGVVVVARGNGAWNGGYGNYVVIAHGNGAETLYAHMTNAIVASGQEVSAGQVIGYVGATGLAYGNHLHFEVRGAANPFRNCPVPSVCSPQ